MKMLNIHEAKTRLSAVLQEIEKTGETIVICRNGKPVADLTPHQSRNRLDPHPVMKQFRIDYDPVEPLADDEWMETDG